jgi:hypothetical protein
MERNGMIWVYMGPREIPPPFPEFEYNTSPPEMCFSPQFHFYDCNWFAALEGDIDSSHINYLHSRLTPEPVPVEEAGGTGIYMLDRTPYILPHATEYGAVYAGKRRWDENGNYYYRITQFCVPFFTMVGGNSNPDSTGFQAWVPLDDEHTVQVSLRCSLRNTVPESVRTAPRDPYARLGGYLPETSDPLTRWRPPATRENDYLINHEIQRTKMFSGIPNDGKTQDFAVMESMGHLYDRRQEHLGSLDSMIILTRRTLIAAAKKLRDDGQVHPTVDNPRLFRVRSAAVVLPEGVDWFQATAEQRQSDAGLELAYVPSDMTKASSA